MGVGRYSTVGSHLLSKLIVYMLQQLSLASRHVNVGDSQLFWSCWLRRQQILGVWQNVTAVIFARTSLLCSCPTACIAVLCKAQPEDLLFCEYTDQHPWTLSAPHQASHPPFFGRSDLHVLLTSFAEAVCQLDLFVVNRAQVHWILYRQATLICSGQLHSCLV